MITASRDHVLKGVEEGFIQANHGKEAPMNKLSKGDGIICYSSKEKYGEKTPCQKFTAIGKVIDDEAYIGSMQGGDFKPHRRDVEFYNCKEADVRPLIEDLDFIKNKKKWGFPFMLGFVEISGKDYELIASRMVKT